MKKLLTAVLLILIGIALFAVLFVQRVLPGEVAQRGDATRTPGLYLDVPWQRWDTQEGSTTFVLLGSDEHRQGAIVTFEGPIGPDSAAQLDANKTSILEAPDLAKAISPYGTLQSHTPLPAIQADAKGVRSALTERLSTLEARAQTEHATASEITGAIEAKVAELNAQSDGAYGAREAALLAELEALHTEAVVYTARRGAEARAEAGAIRADAALVLAKAHAKQDALMAEAVAHPAGRYFSAIRAARRFDARRFSGSLTGSDPGRGAGNLAYWRRFFMGQIRSTP